MAATTQDPLDPLRDGLARMIMTKVAGPDPRAERDRVHKTPGPRWFAPDSPIRRVHGDASMFAGGLRALLLQSLHPLAMAAVSAHSGYRGDPWGRLRRTSYFLAITTYGAIPDAEEAIARVKAVHERVRGTSPDGVKYRASDPHLLKWVHVAEVDSFLAAHQQYGAQPLNAAEQDQYVEDAALVARKLGVVDPPTTVAELRQLLKRVPAGAARDDGGPPGCPLHAGAPTGAMGRATGVRRTDGCCGRTAAVVDQVPLRLPYLPLAEATVVRAAGDGLTRTIRWALASPTSADIGAGGMTRR